MTAHLSVPLILGTAREGRRSEAVARFLLERVRAYGIETQLVDPRDYRLPATDDTKTSDTARRYGEIIVPADGFIIVSPEYNHGSPGELKMMLDMLFEEYARKPVGICGVSSGYFGGVRMLEQMRLVTLDYGMTPIREALHFPNVKTLFDEAGNITDPEGQEKRITKFLDELTWYARALKNARTTEPQ
jgi:NAD(P)H-dependent FMN reductase